MAKVLVTGSAGFIGSHVTDALIKKHDVTGIDNLSTGVYENVNPKSNFIRGDITDKNLWNRLPMFDYVFHLAAIARIQPSIKDPVKTHEANVNGTLNVLEYCRANGSKIIYSSSSSVYGGRPPTKEDSLIKPENPYALQKWIGEEYVTLYGKLYGLEYAILRYFNVYGERQLLEGSYATVLGIFLNQKANGEVLTITGDGEQRRDFTYVGDVANANLLAMNWEGVYNIGNSANLSVNQVAKLVGGKTEHIEARPGEVRITLADNTRARSMGWVPTTSVKSWLNGTTAQI